jgi:Icc-related predicted phosphoesterase
MYASFHGHIHESPRMTKYWCKNVNKGIAIQPGQTEYSKKGILFVEADTDKGEFTYIIKQKGMMTCIGKQIETPDAKLFLKEFEY